MTANVLHRAERRRERWVALAGSLGAALSNLDDNHPGYPASAAAGSGSSSSTRDIHSPVLSAIVAEEESGRVDKAKAAWAQILALDEEIERVTRPLEKLYWDVVQEWAFPVVEANAHHAKLAATLREEHCSNCLAHGVEPCGSIRRYRGDLCRRCYNFKGAEEVLPTAEICRAWDLKGNRGVTTAMIMRAKATKPRGLAKARKRGTGPL